MDVFTIVAVIAIAVALIAIHIRLSPLQVLLDERTARQRAQANRQDTETTEGAALLIGLRKLHSEYAALVRLERGASEAIRLQLNAERLALQESARGRPATPAPKLRDDDGETTAVLNPPRYAARERVESPRARLAHPDLIGSEDIAEEAARPPLGPEDQTPPRRGRTAILLEVYKGTEEGSAS